MGRETWFQNRVVSEFSESQKFVLCDSSEGGGREGIGEKRFVPKGSRGWGVKFESLSSYNQQVPAAGRVTTELLMLINNLWRPMQMYYG